MHQDHPDNRTDTPQCTTDNIRPTTNTTVNVTRTTNDENKRRRLWITLTAWGGATVATLACINDALEILERLGIL